MMRLIDADALIHELNNSHYPGAPYVDAGISIAIGRVCDAPTIEPRCETCEAFNKTRLLIPQPQRKKGEWINIREGNRADCDQCGQSGRAWMNFCFDCGADMREDGEADG